MARLRFLRFEPLEPRRLLAQLALLQATYLDVDVCARGQCLPGGFDVPQEYSYPDPYPYRDEINVYPEVRQSASLVFDAGGALAAPSTLNLRGDVTNLHWGDPLSGSMSFSDSLMYQVEPENSEEVGDPVYLDLLLEAGTGVCRGSVTTAASLQVNVTGKSTARLAESIQLQHDDSAPEFFPNKCVERHYEAVYRRDRVEAAVGDTITVHYAGSFHAALLKNHNEIYPTKGDYYIGLDLAIGTQPDIEVFAAETADFSSVRVFADQSGWDGAVQVQAYRSTDEVLDETDSPVFEAPQQVTLIAAEEESYFDLNLPGNVVDEDRRFVLVEVDPNHQIFEFDEENNTTFVVPFFEAGEQMNREAIKTVSGISESHSERASGPITNIICQGTAAFQQLESLTDVWPYNFFLSAEQESHRKVQQTLIRPTEKLASLIDVDVRQLPEFWEGLNLSINDAWAIGRPHSSRSLHKEARAVDFDVNPYTDPKSNEGLGRLAGLAWLAGFDWVERETSSPHVHASTRRDVTLPQGGCTQIQLRSPANLLIHDSAGRRVGVLPSGEVVNEVPNAYFSGAGTHPQVVTIPGVDLESLTTQVIGTGEGLYHLDVFTAESDTSFHGTEIVKETSPGQVATFQVAPPQQNRDRLIVSNLDAPSGDLTIGVDGDGTVTIGTEDGYVQATVAGDPLFPPSQLSAENLVSATIATESFTNSIDLSDVVSADFPALTRIDIATDANDTVDLGAGWSFLESQIVNNRFVRLLVREQAKLYLAGPRDWQSPINPLDVNADGEVVPFDVLFVINELNHPTVLLDDGTLVAATDVAPFPALFYDVNGDGYGTPLDALTVINALNADKPAEAESGEFWASWSGRGLGSTSSIDSRTRSALPAIPSLEDESQPYAAVLSNTPNQPTRRLRKLAPRAVDELATQYDLTSFLFDEILLP